MAVELPEHWRADARTVAHREMCAALDAFAWFLCRNLHGDRPIERTMLTNAELHADAADAVLSLVAFVDEKAKLHAR